MKERRKQALCDGRSVTVPRSDGHSVAYSP